jgi:hypothetical protein
MKRALGAMSVVAAFWLATALAFGQVEVSPGVGRISLIHGDVSTQRGDSGDWAAAALNQPIVSGDQVSTGERSRSEVQLDHANILRLGDSSQAKIATLTRTQIQVQISQGLADFNVFKGSEADVEIDTPNVAIRPNLREGIYRIEVNSNGETQLIVRKGEAEISTPQGSTRVEKGQSVTVRGSGDDTQYKIAGAPSKDSWDSWNSDRNGLIRNAQAWSRTNQYYVGSEDLDAYGRWITVPDYGPVWAPTVAVDWVPYRAGRWVWEPYWGWTWVSYEPWGWAPYHYGRWFRYQASWVWWPGPVYGYRHYRPLWAPAYVSFFGFGGNWGVSFGFGSVGWLPVGPCDPYFPWYGRYRSHFNVVNVTNITNIYNIRKGQRFDGIAPLRGGNRHSNLRLAMNDEHVRRAISNVPAEHFGTGRVRATAVDGKVFRDGRMMRGNLPVVPTRQALAVTDRAANPSTLHRQQERFFMKSRPATPMAFDRQATEVQQSIQRSGRFTPIRSGNREAVNLGSRDQNAAAQGDRRTTLPARVQRGDNTDRNGNPGREGWQRFGSDEAQNRQPQRPEQSPSNARRPVPSPRQSGKAQDTKPAGPDQSGWRRFSEPDSGRNVNRPGSSQGPRENRVHRPPSAMNVSPSRNANPVDRGGRVSQPSGERDREWRPFTQQPERTSPRSIEPDRPNREWNRFPSRSDAPSRPDTSREAGPRGYGDSMRGSRPPLDLRRPIVTPRQSPGGSGAYGGGSRGSERRSEPRSGGGNRGGSGNSGQSRGSSNNRHR